MGQGLVQVTGAGRATRYALTEKKWSHPFPIGGLEEHLVDQRLAAEFEAVGTLEGEVATVVSYIVAELVNNAIDHSGGEEVRVSAREAGGRLIFEFDDDGVGAFAHVREELELADDLSAIQELSKGKTTTAPEHHSGEGLFFVSKAANVFRMESGSLAWIVDNDRGDVAIESLASPRRGTRLIVEVDTAQVHDLTAIFAQYTEDYGFTKTRTTIKLFTIGVRFMSRSQAKRLLHGLDQFREIVLDFSGVKAVGQGFADEVFRIWAKAHEGISLIPVNMNDAVAFMVKRAGRAL